MSRSCSRKFARGFFETMLTLERYAEEELKYD